jgi:L-ribulose-5-phosphate 3-epimerase
MAASSNPQTDAIAAPRLGVCSWSVRPSGAGDLVRKLREAGVNAVQLALDPIRSGAWPEAQSIATLRAAGIRFLSGMMATRGEDYSTLDSIRRTGGLRPDSTWDDNLRAAGANADLAARLGITLVTFHAGFVPKDPRDPERPKLVQRLRQIADAFKSRGIRIGLETGQESAETLAALLDELGADSVGVNFDPGNMILYGMGDPVAALRLLAPRVFQIHIKDAHPAAVPGAWGREFVVGTGSVNWPAFFDAYRQSGLRCDLVVEREAGENRAPDIVAARHLVERFVRIEPVSAPSSGQEPD